MRSRSLPHQRRPGSLRARLVLPGAMLAALSLAACAGHKGGASRTDSGGPVRSASGNSPRDNAQDRQSDLDKAASDLERLFDQRAAGSPTPAVEPPRLAAAPAPTRAPAAPVVSPLRNTSIVTGNRPVRPLAPDVYAPPMPSTTTVADTGDQARARPAPAANPADATGTRRRDLVTRLADLILENAGGGSDAMRTASRLMALELIQPGIVEPDLERLLKDLPPAQAQTLRAIRELLGQLGSESMALDDPAQIARVLTDMAHRLSAAQSLGVPVVALCSSVESFGSYTAFPSNTFLQGRSQPAIVYVEVENFSQRPGVTLSKGARAAAPADDGDTVVELGQELTLYHDADGLPVWRKPEQVVRDAFRRKRHDYYLAQYIELPATLTIGRYALKVTVRDKATGAVAEANIPINIVADSSLLGDR